MLDFWKFYDIFRKKEEKMRKLLLIFLSLFILFCEEKAPEIGVHFSPKGGAESAIINEIEKSRDEVNVAMYIFTNRRIAQALVKAKERGVKVKVLLDQVNLENEFSKAMYLHNNGISVKIDKSHSEDEGIMHNKFAIYDNNRITTGSFNWTASAEYKNDENLLVIRDKNIAKIYKEKFDKLWERKGAIPFSEAITSLKVKEVLSAKDLESLRKNAGKWSRVRGVVENVGYSARSNTYFLNFGPRGKSFTVVIFDRVVKEFEKRRKNIENFEEKLVEVEGKIIDHPKYGLEILLRSPEDITIVKQ